MKPFTNHAKKITVFVTAAVLSVTTISAQSHISTGKYACQLVPASLGYGKYTCPACEKNMAQERANKAAEEKRKQEALLANQKADKEANDKLFKQRQAERAKSQETTNLSIGNPSYPSGSTSTSEPVKSPSYVIDPSSPSTQSSSSANVEALANGVLNVFFGSEKTGTISKDQLMADLDAKIEAEKVKQSVAAEQKRIADEAALVRLQEQRAQEARRKELLNSLPLSKIPLSSERVAVDKLYFFGYSYNQATDGGYPVLQICKPFAVGKYGDGTWPFHNSVMTELATANKGQQVTLVGRYNSDEEAFKAYERFYNDANMNRFKTGGFNYKGKNQTSEGATDYWGNNTTSNTPKTAAASNTSDDDFWGTGTVKNTTSTVKQPAKNASTDPKTKAASNSESDFWGAPVNPGSQTPITQNNETDFWGNPVAKPAQKTNGGTKTKKANGTAYHAMVYAIVSKGACDDSPIYEHTIVPLENETKEWARLQNDLKAKYPGRKITVSSSKFALGPNATNVCIISWTKTAGNCTNTVIFFSFGKSHLEAQQSAIAKKNLWAGAKTDYSIIKEILWD